MQLARPAAERLLDLRPARAAFDAQDLVVVPLHRWHPELALVNGFEESREAAGGVTDGVDRRRVIHPQRADDSDGSQIAVAEPVIRTHDAHRAELGRRVLVSN